LFNNSSSEPSPAIFYRPSGKMNERNMRRTITRNIGVDHISMYTVWCLDICLRHVLDNRYQTAYNYMCLANAVINIKHTSSVLCSVLCSVLRFHVTVKVP
jgi:hypothetical protein